MIRFDHLHIDYRPYPIGLIKPAFADDVYRELSETFPGPDIVPAFHWNADGEPSKYSLSEKSEPAVLRKFLATHRIWATLFEYLKSQEFIYATLAALRDSRIDLMLPSQRATSILGKAKKCADDLLRGHWPIPHRRLRTNIEFSLMPANNGYIRPHSDAPAKLITLVISMANGSEWKHEFGGGTEVVEPLDPSQDYNLENRSLDFDQVNTIRVYEYQANQCVLFVKTFNSWHAVRPMNAGGDAPMRKTLTVNIV